MSEHVHEDNKDIENCPGCNPAEHPLKPKRGPKKGSINRAGVQKFIRNAVERGKWYGYEVDTDKGPADIALQELTESYALTSYIKDHIATNFPDAEELELTKLEFSEAGATRVPSEEAYWFEWALRERKHLLDAVKVCHGLGIDEKRIELAQANAEMMYRVVVGLMDGMNLSEDQKALAYKMLPVLIRQQAVANDE